MDEEVKSLKCSERILVISPEPYMSQVYRNHIELVVLLKRDLRALKENLWD